MKKLSNGRMYYRVCADVLDLAHVLQEARLKERFDVAGKISGAMELLMDAREMLRENLPGDYAARLDSTAQSRADGYERARGQRRSLERSSTGGEGPATNHCVPPAEDV